MSCAAPSFVRRHLYFRVTTSLLTVLPQLAHLALLQASISLVLILTCTNPTAPQASWPMSLGSFCAKSQTFCFAWHPSCCCPPPPLIHSITDPAWYHTQDLPEPFSLPEKTTSNFYWIVVNVVLSPTSSWGRTCRRKATMGTKASMPLQPRNIQASLEAKSSLTVLNLKFCTCFLQSYK